MNKLFGGSLIVWSVLTLAPAVGLAEANATARIERSHATSCTTAPRFRRWTQTRGQQVSVPELDPGAAGQALALLIGGTAVLLGRTRKRSRS